MARIHHLLVASAILGCAQIASAQSTAPASDPAVIGVTPAPIVPAAPAAAGGAMTSGGPSEYAQPAPPATPAQQSGGYSVGTIVQTEPPSEAATAAELSGDPFIMRREARAQARQEYRSRVDAAKREYREDKRAADALLYQQRQSGY